MIMARKVFKKGDLVTVKWVPSHYRGFTSPSPGIIKKKFRGKDKYKVKVYEANGVAVKGVTIAPSARLTRRKKR